MKVIDSHLHVWDLDRADYPWLGPHLAPIDVSLGIDDVRADLRLAAVDGVVLVQAADNAEDTDNMFAVADRAPEVVGVVAWAPLDDPELTARRIAELRADPTVRRHPGAHPRHGRPGLDRPSRPGRRPGDAGSRSGVPFDYVTADPAALRHVPTICARHPDLRLVIDHLGKPPVGGSAEQLRSWRELLARAAESPSVYAKISGLYPAGRDAIAGPGRSAPDRRRRARHLRAGAAHAGQRLADLGPRRRVPPRLGRAVPDRRWSGPTEREAILGGTAAAFYGLGTA